MEYSLYKPPYLTGIEGPPPKRNVVSSSLAGGATSEQALYRLLRLFFKSQSALMPLLLLSKSQPLRWAAIWFRRIAAFLFLSKNINFDCPLQK